MVRREQNKIAAAYKQAVQHRHFPHGLDAVNSRPGLSFALAPAAPESLPAPLSGQVGLGDGLVEAATTLMMV